MGVLALLICAAPAMADTVTFNVSSGALSAQAVFTTSGSNLIVTLTNTAASPAANPAMVLTALFFSLAGNPVLTPVSALLGPTSVVLYGPSNGGNMGGEWAYGSGLSGAPLGAAAGISSSGFGLFGGANFNGANLQGPAAVDGVQYGLLPAGGNAGGNAAVTGQFGLIQNEVIFTLSGLPAGYTLANSITNVSFQYGTSLGEPNIPIPEPTSLILFGSGLLGLAAAVRRRLQ